MDGLSDSNKSCLFEQLSNIFPQGLLFLNSKNIIAHTNIKFFEMFGLGPSIFGKHIDDIFPNLEIEFIDQSRPYELKNITCHVSFKKLATIAETFSLLIFDTLPYNIPSNRLLQAAFLKLTEVIDEGVNITDDNSIMRFYNKKQLETDGITESDVIGKCVYDDGMITKETSVLHKVIQTGKPILNYEQHYCNYDNKFIKLHGCAYPIIDSGKQLGAIGVFRKPKPDVEIIRKIVSPTISKTDTAPHPNKKTKSLFRFEDIIGINNKFLQQVDMAKLATVGDSPIFLYGETGTGKELFAQSIHMMSERRSGAFIAVNCAAVPESLFEGILFGTALGAFTGAKNRKGLLEEANHGTLFLDEINSMPLLLQSKLLRAIEEKKVRRLGGKREKSLNLRVISSSNIDPLKAIEENILRQDLFYRLAVIFIRLPPLRERYEDIVLLTNYFIKKISKKLKKNVKKISPETLRIIQNHHWPGNVRQLMHYIECIISVMPEDDRILSHTYMPHYYNFFSAENNQMPQSDNNEMDISRGKTNVFESIKQRERENIINVLFKNNGNITKSAEDLSISRRALYYRMKKYNIK
jgi:arginine utilization regulatory protein